MCQYLTDYIFNTGRLRFKSGNIFTYFTVEGQRRLGTTKISQGYRIGRYSIGNCSGRFSCETQLIIICIKQKNIIFIIQKDVKMRVCNKIQSKNIRHVDIMNKGDSGTSCKNETILLQ